MNAAPALANPADSPEARLRRMQRSATALLAAAAALLAASHVWRDAHPAWAWLGAFAEAALVGGLADWFAVVALFRRPLGLPIWHTAIIPARKDDIARNLGEFVETHLLTPEALRKEVAEGDLAERLAEALQQPETADALAGWLLQATPQLLASLDDERLAAWLAEAVHAELMRLDLPELSGRAATRLANAGQHQRVLDAVAGALQRYVADPEHLGAIAEFLARALNLDNAIYKTMIKAAAPRATQALAHMLGELRAAEEHPWRTQLDTWVQEWVQALPQSEGWRTHLGEWQTEALASPSAQAWLHGLWPRLKARLLAALGNPQPGATSPAPLSASLSGLVRQLGHRLHQDPALRASINQALADTLAGLVQRHRGASARFLEAQLARWSPAEMSDKVELAIGRDLQFIRINGTLVGGLVGLVLHALRQL
jgi:uncharacterized membrane-anchored protein YjiN (DUF445 family)